MNVLFAAKFSQSSKKFSADLGTISVLPSGIFRSRMFIRMLSMQLKRRSGCRTEKFLGDA